MKKSKTHYMVLGLPPSSSTSALHDRYLSMAKAIHPDLPGNEDGKAMRELTEAWGVLRNEATRKQYDTRLKLEGNQCKACKGQGTSNKTIKFNRTERRVCSTCQGAGQ